MTRSGRPEVGPMLSLRFPRELTERLDALAEERDTTRSALIRLAVERFLEEDTMTDPTTITLPFDVEDNDLSDPSYLDYLAAEWLRQARDTGLGEDDMRLWSVEIDRPEDEIAYVGPADGPRYALEVKPSGHPDSTSGYTIRCVERA